jgi:hypothetical protein
VRQIEKVSGRDYGLIPLGLAQSLRDWEFKGIIVLLSFEPRTSD